MVGGLFFIVIFCLFGYVSLVLGFFFRFGLGWVG